MSIGNRQAAKEYNAALGKDLGTSARDQWVASVTDRVMGDLVKGFHDAGLKFPGDDRCFNLEVSVWLAAIDANKT